MNHALTKEAMEKRQEEDFHAFMSGEHIKVLISLIPEREIAGQGPSRESLKALLRATFDAGHASGTSFVVISILESIMKGGPPI